MCVAEILTHKKKLFICYLYARGVTKKYYLYIRSRVYIFIYLVRCSSAAARIFLNSQTLLRRQRQSEQCFKRAKELTPKTEICSRLKEHKCAVINHLNMYKYMYAFVKARGGCRRAGVAKRDIMKLYLFARAKSFERGKLFHILCCNFVYTQYICYQFIVLLRNFYVTHLLSPESSKEYIYLFTLF